MARHWLVEVTSEFKIFEEMIMVAVADVIIVI